MDNAEFDAGVATEVREALRLSGKSVNWLATEARIPYATLDRKLHVGSSFTVSELHRIGKAMGRQASTFLPDDFARAVAS